MFQERLSTYVSIQCIKIDKLWQTKFDEFLDLDDFVIKKTRTKYF